MILEKLFVICRMNVEIWHVLVTVGRRKKELMEDKAKGSVIGQHARQIKGKGRFKDD